MITYRHNIMMIGNLDTFFNLRGGYHDGVRDVYFVRALGEDKNLVQKLQELETMVNTAVYQNRLQYNRISELPRLCSMDDIDFYSRSFDDWMRTHRIRLRNAQGDALFQETLSKATGKIISEYRLVKANANDTIVKNFIIKLFFWVDCVLKDVIPTWTERASVKIIGENVGKEQEYLFYYMLTLLGCDVLLLNTRADVLVPETMKALSKDFRIGPYGSTPLPPYVYREPAPVQPVAPPPKREPVSVPQPQPQYTAPPVRPASRTSPIPRQTTPVAVPRTQPRTETDSRRSVQSPARAPAAQSEPITPAAAVMQTPEPVAPKPSASDNPAEKEKKSRKKQEKSYEELAAIASSIVMIGVHNRKGDVTATGSGIMISKTGYILTNAHVVKDGVFYSVRIEEDDELYATQTVVKKNEHLDLAVIRIDRRLKPVPIYKGRAKLVRGQKVVAIGSPLGLFNSVSDGIISGFRNINDRDMIQFTAPISHGSSGGAVLNMYGEVVGISTAGIESGQNINLAVPYDSIRDFAGQFID